MYNFIDKHTPAQDSYCEFLEIFRSAFFTEHPPATVSEKIIGQKVLDISAFYREYFGLFCKENNKKRQHFWK